MELLESSPITESRSEDKIQAKQKQKIKEMEE